jgi:hypothetical protein
MDMRTLAAFFVALLAGCNADLETACVGGDCSPYVPTKPPLGECYDDCDLTQPSFTSGEYPCAVDAIIDNCRRCHLPDGIRAPTVPFSLDTYLDAQALYFDKVIWGRMEPMVSADFMPLEPPKLTADEKAILLDGWACQCAPPRPPGEVCD